MGAHRVKAGTLPACVHLACAHTCEQGKMLAVHVHTLVVSCKQVCTAPRRVSQVDRVVPLS